MPRRSLRARFAVKVAAPSSSPSAMRRCCGICAASWSRQRWATLSARCCGCRRAMSTRPLSLSESRIDHGTFAGAADCAADALAGGHDSSGRRDRRPLDAAKPGARVRKARPYARPADRRARKPSRLATHRGRKRSCRCQRGPCPYRKYHPVGERKSESGDVVARCWTPANCFGRCYGSL